MNNDPNPIVEDWGQISSAAVTFDDYGSVNEVWTSYEIWTTEYLYVGAGTLFELGNGLERQLAPYLGSGTVRFNGSGSVVRGSAISVGGTISFFDQESENLWGVDGLQTLYDDYGVVADIIPFTTQNWGVIGSVLNSYQDTAFVSSYNLSSVYSEEQADFNYGLLTENFDEIIDYDSILIYSDYYDYGNVNNSTSYTTSNPFGLTRISNVEINSNTNVYVGSGNIVLSGIGDIDILGNPVESTALFKFTNSSDNFRSKSFSGSGFLSNINGSSLAFSESTDSNIQLFNVTGSASVLFFRVTIENTILFSVSGQGITENPLQAYVTGSGLLEISTDSCVEKNTESYNDSSIILYNWGDVSAIATSYEDYENPSLPWNNLPEEFGSVANNAEGNLLPFGAINAFGTALESNTEFYNESSVFKDSDYGFIVDAASVIDNGSPNGLLPNGYPVDYLTIDIPVSLTTPYGSSNFSGAATEKFVSNPPENTILFNISGAGLTKVGNYSWKGSGTTSFFNNATYSETDVEVGSGTIGFVSGAAEVFGVNPPESTQLFSVSGAGISQEIATYTKVGSGSIIVSGAAGTDRLRASDSTILFSLSGSANTDLSRALESTILFSLSGSATEKNTESYNESSIFDGNYGSIEDLAVPIDNGFIFDTNPFITNYGSLEDIAPQNTPYGFAISTGAATTQEIASYTKVGSGSIIVSGAAGTDRLRASESTILFSLSGSATEKNTESYNDSAIIEYNWGSVAEFATQSEDYEDSIPTLPWITGPEDFGSLLDTTSGDITPFGPITFLSGAAEVFGANPEETTQLFYVSGDAITKEIASYSAITSGSIVISGSAIIKSKLTVLINGSGDIIITGAAETDRVRASQSTILFSLSGSAEETFIANPPESTQLFGVSGAATYSETDAEVGSGSIIVSGAAGTDRLRASESTILFSLSGSAEETFIGNPLESTQLFSVSGSAQEKNTESYNESSIFDGNYGSIEDSAVPIDNGFVSDLNPYPFDYGLLEIGVAGNTPYGYVISSGVAITQEIASYTAVGSGSIVVSGAAGTDRLRASESTILFSLSGSAEEKNTESYNESSNVQYNWGSVAQSAVESEDYEDSLPILPWVTGPEDFGSLLDIATGDITPFGSITFLSGSAEVFGANPEESTQLFDLSGAAVTQEIATYIKDGSGSIIISGTARIVSKLDIKYTGSGTTSFFNNATYSETDTEVGSGNIGFVSGAAEVFGANPPESTQLFGVSGAATYSETDAEVGSGSIIVSGAAGTDRLRASESTILFNASGTATYSETDAEVGSGAINVFGIAIESNTESYNDSSIFDGNYGSIQDPATVIDIGLITEVGANITYGLLEDALVENIPYGFVISSGVAITQEIASYVAVGSGQASFSGAADTDRLRASESTILFSVSGAAAYSETDTEVGSGALTFSDSSALVIGVNPPENIQLFTLSGVGITQEIATYTAVGSGSILVFGAAGTDRVRASESTILFRLSGSAVEKNTESYNESSNVQYNWGSIAEFAIESEDYEDSIPTLPWVTGQEDFGSLLDATTEDITPFGSITIFGSAVEKNTDSYNESSIFDGDYGSIQDPATVIENGFILDLDPSQTDYGSLEDTSIQNTPYGFVVSSGVAVTAEIATYANIGSGSIVISGTAKIVSKLDIKYAGSGFIDAFGAGIYSETDAEVGSGFIGFVSGAAEVFGANPSESTQLFNVSGAATYSETDAEVGSGSLFVSGGHAEVFVANPPESIQLFSVSGTATYSETDVEVGSGTLRFSDSSALVIGVNPPESTQLFSVSGAATYSETDAEVGSGSITVFGSVDINFTTSADESTILFRLFGSAEEKNTESYNESSNVQYNWGSIAEFATESEDYEDSIPTLPWVTGPEDFGSLLDVAAIDSTPFGSITIFGSAVEKNTDSYNESSIFDGNYGSIQDPAIVIDNGLITDIAANITYGLIEIIAPENTPYGVVVSSGVGVTAEIAAYTNIGSGSIIISGVAKVVSKLDIKYTGSGTTSFFNNATYSETDVEVGSGTIGFVSGAAEVFGANPPESTQLFSVSGAATYSETDTEIGSGQATFFGAADTDRVRASESTILFTLSGVATHSETDVEVGSGTLRFSDSSALVIGVNPPESTQLFSVSGAAAYSETDAEVGSGSIVVFGAAGTDRVRASDSTILFRLSGSAAEKNTESYNESSNVQYNWGFVSQFAVESEDYEDSIPTLPWITGPEDFGSVTNIATGDITPFGSISVFGSAVEKNTDSYNESSIFDGDYGSIQDPGIIGDYGFVYEIPESVNYGTLNDLVVENTPYGTSTFLGQASNIKNTESYVGSGSIVVSGAAGTDRIRVTGKESTIIFEISGSAAHSETDVFVASGQSVFSGVGVTKLTSFYEFVGQGSTNFFGAATYSETDTEVGSGFIGFVSGAAEVFGANPPESIQLFRVSGAATHSETDVFTASGNVFITGTADYREVDAYAGSGQFNLTGNVGESESEVYNGSGEIKVSGKARIVSRLDIRYPGFVNAIFFGAATYSETDAEVGSGFITPVSGAAEVFGANPPESTQLFSVSGAATYKETDVEVGSGSLFTSGGHAEVFVANPPENVQLFNVSGAATYSETDAEVGSGTLRFSDSSALVIGVNPPENTQLFSVSGAATYSETDVEVGSGTLRFSDSSALVIGVNPPESTQLFNVAGAATYSETDAEVGSGSITVFGAATYSETDVEVGSGSVTFFSGAAEVFGANPPENIQLFSVSGAAIYSETDSEVGSGFITFFSSAAEVFGANPPESIQLFNVFGAATYRETDVEVGSGSLFVSGAATYRETDAEVGSGQIIISGNAVESESEAFSGSGLFKFSDIGAEVFGANPPENIQLFKVSGAATYSETDVEVGSGSIATTGAAVYRETDAEVGSGSITFLSGAAEVFGANPPENIQLFRVSGIAAYSETDVKVGSGQTTFSGIASTAEFAVYTASTSGTITLSGVAETKEIAVYQDYITSGTITLSDVAGVVVGVYVPSYKGSGSLFTVSGSSEAFGANPPENIQLFNVSGAAETREIAIVQEISVGPQYVFSGGATDLKRSHVYREFVGAIKYTNLSESKVKHTEAYVGSGAISAISGAAEVFGANPQENTQLFAVTGSANTRETNLYQAIGSGQITTGEFASGVRLTKKEVGVGSVNISGGFDIIVRLRIFGSGVISALSGAAEVYGPNPPENIQLFNISGSASTSERNSYPVSGSGETSFFGNITEKNTDSYVGFGSVKFFSGAAEVFGANPPETTQLFNVSGAAAYRETTVEVGSGYIENTGASKENIVSTYNGQGNIVISGKQTSPATFEHIGSGSLFAAGGTAEVFGANPVEQTLLYRFEGSAKDTHTEKYSGFGSIATAGNAKDIHAESYVGSGIVSTVSGAAGVFGANPPESIQLFVVTGSAITSKLQKQSYDGFTETEISGSSIEKKSTPFKGLGIVGLYPSSEEKHTESYVGDGNISSVGGSAIAKGANPQEDISLYQISGAATTRSIASFVTSGSVSLQGNSEEKNTEDYTGSGRIIISGTTSGQYGIVSITDTIIFNFVGNAKARVRFAPVCETINYVYGDNNALTEVRSFDPPSLFVSIF